MELSNLKGRSAKWLIVEITRLGVGISEEMKQMIRKYHGHKSFSVTYIAGVITINLPGCNPYIMRVKERINYLGTRWDL